MTDFHILSTHVTDGGDTSPLQIISDKRLSQLLEIEAAHARGVSMKYAPINPATVVSERAAEIAAGRPLRANLFCHYCACTVGAGALWCSTDCAERYMAERAAATKPST